MTEDDTRKRFPKTDARFDSGAGTRPAANGESLASEADTSERERSAGRSGLFDGLLGEDVLFCDREVLRPSYTPDRLPHRSEQVEELASIFASVLRGDSPSNVLVYGKTGTGKTASARYVGEELDAASREGTVPCDVAYVNCEVTDTQYRVLARLTNAIVERNEAAVEDRLAELRELVECAAANPDAFEDSPFDSLADVDAEREALRADAERFETAPTTGWPTDRVYSALLDAVDYRARVVIVVLDEVDKLVEKSGDDVLYNLTRANANLEDSRLSVVGISNDLRFTDALDPRVRSSLGEEEIVFPPYDADQLRDILRQRAAAAFERGALSDDVVPLCAAFAAQEHGDARRALDLLRTAGELAERDRAERVTASYVRRAQEKVEVDRVAEVVRTLPTQSKLVLYAVVLLQRAGAEDVTTDTLFTVYARLCGQLGVDALSERRVTTLVGELDMLGILNAAVVGTGRSNAKTVRPATPLRDVEGVLRSGSSLNALDEKANLVESCVER